MNLLFTHKRLSVTGCSSNEKPFMDYAVISAPFLKVNRTSLSL
jgi:hypothetical protein